MADYEETKQNLLRQSGFGSLRGVPLNGHRKRKGWMAIRPCICVGPEGCPCDTLDDVILWIPSSVDSVRIGKKCEGDELLAYAVDSETQILVETQLPMTVGQLQKAKRVAETGTRHTRVVFHKSADIKGKLSVRALLVGAFELGWEIGEKIDAEKTGLMDRLWNWLAEKSSSSQRSDRSRSKSIVHIEPGTET